MISVLNKNLRDLEGLLNIFWTFALFVFFSSESSESSYESDANADKRNQEFLASSLSGDKAFSSREKNVRASEPEARGKEPVNISPWIPRAARWSNEQPKYRTEGCLLASLAASSRLKKPRKDGGGEKKGKKKRRRAGEKNCAARERPSDFIASREKERST